jgi:hypothetical protein
VGQDEPRQGVAGLAVGALGMIEQVLRGLYRCIGGTRSRAKRLEQAHLRREAVKGFLVSHAQAPEFINRAGNLRGHNCIDARKSTADRNFRQVFVVGQSVTPVRELSRSGGRDPFPARLVTGSGVGSQMGQHVLLRERAAARLRARDQGGRCVRLRRQQ